ncbi:MFS transporter [soil metagenome]
MSAQPGAGAVDNTAPGRWFVPLLTLATFITMLHAITLGPFLPEIATDLDTRVALLGQIPALAMLLAAALGLAAGPLADQLGHNRVLVGSLLIVAVSALGMALAPSYLPLLLAALVGSIGRAVVQPVAVVIVGNRFEGDRQRRAVSWVMAGVAGAVIAGVPVLTTIAGAFGWRSAFVGVAIITASLGILVHRGIGSDERSAQSKTSFEGILDAYRPLMRHYPTFALIIASLLASAAIWVMATYLGAFYSERHSYTTQQIGWVYAVPGLTLFIGSLAAGGRVGTLPLRPLVVVTRLVAGIAIASVLILPIPALAGIGFLALQGVASSVGIVATIFLLMRESPAGQAVTISLNTVALSLGSALGSALGGLLLAVGDFHLLGLCALLLSVGSALLVWISGNTAGERASVHAVEHSG